MIGEERTLDSQRRHSSSEYRWHLTLLQLCSDESCSFTIPLTNSNKQLVEYIKKLAASKNATAAQVSLAWILASDTSILPIPGTRRMKYLNENVGAAEVKLDDGEYKELNDYINAFTPKGSRYPEGASVAF